MAYVQRAWILIFYSLAAEASLMAVMIVQGYWESSIWFKGPRWCSERVLVVQTVNWSLGLLRFGAFIAGLAFLAYVSATPIPSRSKLGVSAVSASIVDAAEPNHREQRYRLRRRRSRRYRSRRAVCRDLTHERRNGVDIGRDLEVGAADRDGSLLLGSGRGRRGGARKAKPAVVESYQATGSFGPGVRCGGPMGRFLYRPLA